MGASQSTSSSTITHEIRKYDVFVSFRGEDTSNNIASHLYEALCGKGIHTFIDYQLKRGDELSPALRKAIEESMISIVIFSKDYGSSKWCLCELAEIIKYKKSKKQIVIPVFYDIDPSDVRKQTGSFENSFVMHDQKESREEVKLWREALTEAANLSGWDSSVIRPEARLVDKIVQDVLKKLNVISPSGDNQSLVGIDSRIEWVKSLLSTENLDFRVVGIWGMGGIGKTTIVGAVFDQISSQFEGACFIENVREQSEKHGGLVHLRDQVLSQILGENINLGSPSVPQFVKRKLESKKVFIVLDDVNSLRQLEILAGGIDRFGPGSRIILTTRYKQVLLNFGVRDDLYKVGALYTDEALQLFCKHAFKEDHPTLDLMTYTQRVVDYAKGNPLALKVLGSSMYRRSKQDWESVLHKLNKISNPEIHCTLKISFDGLDHEEQDIFLDIACFFKGEKRDYVTQLLDGCYFSTHAGISVLVAKSLITISRSNKIRMHDLLQEMGREIVQQKSFNKPGKLSRLHNQEDVCLVLRSNLGTEAVKGMFLNMSKIKNLDLDSQVFERMYNLRYLKFYSDSQYSNNGDINISNVNLPHDLNYLPNELRYFHWNGYPSKALPSNFSLENLVQLDLSSSNLERLWEGKKHAPKLKRLNLSRSCITEMPDFSNSTCLEVIQLVDCKNLLDINSSLQYLNKLRLVELYISHCAKLKQISTGFCKLKSLETLLVTDCSKLESFPEILETMERLDVIYLCRTAIKELPSSIENMNGLRTLFLRKCKNLGRLPDSFCNMKCLEELEISDCSKLVELPENLGNLRSLKCLNAARAGVTQLPSSLTDLVQLTKLDFSGCKGLTLPPLASSLGSLSKLFLNDCNLVQVPEDIGCLSSLEYLELCANPFGSLPESIKHLSKLRVLRLNDCSMLQSLPEFPVHLKELEAMNCKELQSSPDASDYVELIIQRWTIVDFHFRETSFIFTNCLKLDLKAFNNNSLSLSHTVSLNIIMIFMLQEDRIRTPVSFLFPGSEIPDWFSHRSFGSSISVQLTPLQHNWSTCEFQGFALCAVIAFEEYYYKEPSSLYSIRFECHFETIYGRKVAIPGSLSVNVGGQYTNEAFINSDHVALGYWDYSKLIKDWDDYTTFSFKFWPSYINVPNCRVKSVGVCPIYEELNVTQSCISVEKFGTINSSIISSDQHMGASQSTSSSTTNHEIRKYDVFVSFRGEDSNNITSHLYEALCRKKINTFKYNQLNRGDEILPALRQVIEESMISVVIFSKDYASSKRCLRELLEIIKFKKTKKHIVIPVFYNVDPSDVRKQTGSFKNSFVMHEKESREEVKLWREALNEAANLSGWDSFIIRSEARLVDKIVQDVLKKLNVISPPGDNKSLVGIDSRIKWVKSLLSTENLDFRVVGIWGMGGIGKTTIVGAVFDQISSQFEGACFIENVREQSEKHGGLVHLRDQVLSQILGENINLGSPSVPPFVKRKLESKKVFIVLDDVNSLRQLEILAGGIDRFGPGSRIILTTRYKQVLLNFGVRDYLYKVDALYTDEALQLFCKYAFKEDHPILDLMTYTQRVVDYAKGNPLALKVLGSSMYQRSKQDWESVLHKLNKISNPEIHSMLKISFDGLDHEEQDIFLDIACFFKEENRDYVTQLLDGCYFSTHAAISVLIEKSLITIPRSNKIRMHDLLQEMGREIVRQKSFNKPGKRSRLYNQEDVCLVLKRNLGTEAIKGMFLNMSKIKNLDLDSQAFERMYNLRYLKFYNDNQYSKDRDINISKVNLPRDLNYLPNQLRYLHWNGYPSKALPSNFTLENLVELDLSSSNLERLWEGKKHAPKLKRLNLSQSCLTEMPDLSNAPCLEVIQLLDCKNLLDINSSLQHLNKLRYLYLSNCKSLRSLSTNIHFESPVTLDLSGCTNLMEFPQVSGKIKKLDLINTGIEEIPSSIGGLTGLVELYISQCAKLKQISTSFCKLKSLETLLVTDCSKLESFPEILETMERLDMIYLCGTAIKELPSSIENLNGLRKLLLRKCKNLGRLPDSFCNLKCLEELEISDCSKLIELPDNLGNLRSLKWLNATRSGVSRLPSSLTYLVQLQTLDCSDCKGFTLPPLSSSLGAIRKLFLNDCNLVQVPEDIGCLPLLEYLELCANDFESLPESIKHLSRLRVLRLNDCSMLQSLPEFPERLQHLETMNCTELQLLPDASDFAELIIQRWTNVDLHFMETCFIFTNCLKLDLKALNKVLEELLLRVQEIQTTSFKEDRIRTPVSFLFPGNEIPDWFSHRCFGSSINVQLAPLQYNWSNCEFQGFALCAVVEFQEFYYNEPSSVNYIRFECHFKTIYGRKVAIPGSLSVSVGGQYRNKAFINSDHVALGYWDYSKLIKDWDDYTTFSFKFWPSFNVPNCRVKCVGVCPIYEEPNTTQSYISVEKFGTISQDFVEFPDETDTNNGGGSGSRLDHEEMNPCAEIITGSKSTRPLINNKVVLFYRTLRDYFWILILCLLCGLCVFGILGILVFNKVVLFYRTLRDRVGLFLFYFWILIACLFCGLCVFGMLGILVLHLSNCFEIYLSSHVKNMQEEYELPSLLTETLLP
ncbi:hypothetical protein Ddye_011681 [Dipteronia dyeriana]|uniref:ADP-ribosyl cyclase/cyclic ADP-ribose hydrolase n=1 Tax=Dipteronia dyeriana TaxID=168575 RepID=A0AAD9X2Z0_9ROSI|nr:hypothetical protein Ddye_011681 [Dipteronia dyeriana]